MEERRIREVAKVVEQGFEQHDHDARALAAHLQDRGVSLVDLVEAIEDVHRLDAEEAEGVASMLRVAVEQLREADQARR